LRAIVAYGQKVYGLCRLFGAVQDGRRKPWTTAVSVAAAVFYAGLLRIRSFNALEPRLSEKPFLRLLDRSKDSSRLCSVDTLSRALRVMDLEKVRGISVSILRQAERNKVFRDGWYGGLRFVAVDGTELICSRSRHCSECLVRTVRVKGPGGEISEVAEYYHRYSVAMLIDKRFDMVLDFEPILPQDLRPLVVKGKRLVKPDTNEGELTASKRLIKRVKQTFGWVEVVVGDALYANGPFLTTVKNLGMGAVIIAKKETDEPLKDALQLFKDQAPQIVENKQAGERIELWDCPDLETLATYDGTIRVVRARLTRARTPDTPSTWCMLVTGKAKRLAVASVLAVARGRWHIENTGFHQWVTRWRFDHVFLHHGRGVRALFWLFFAAFNLLTLYLYCQRPGYGRGRGKDVTRTISRLIDRMLDDLARLDRPLWDTS
jgi:hypothetical protein